MSESENPRDQRLTEFEDQGGEHPGGPAYVEQEVRVEEATQSGEVALDGTPVDEHEKQRRDRLDPENRPENAEVDNTQRDFDFEKGMFTDSDGYEEAPAPFPPAGEQGA